jgi:hypothetical protein
VYVRDCGVTVFEAADGGPLPFALLALTVHETGTPSLSAPTMIGEAAADAEVPAQLAVYEVMGRPPSSGGAVNFTTTSPSPATALTDVGACGTVEGVTLLDVAGGPAPAAFVATTVQATATPFASPLTTMGETLVAVALRVPHVAV